MKTKEQVEELRQQWLKDPCWDLEDTEGFEEFRDQLFHYRMCKQAEWKYLREEKLIDWAEARNFPTKDIVFIEYIKGLEDQIQELKRQMEK